MMVMSSLLMVLTWLISPTDSFNICGVNDQTVRLLHEQTYLTYPFLNDDTSSQCKYLIYRKMLYG